MWLVSTGETRGNLPFRLERGEYLVGRSREAQILIKDRTISKVHARFVCSGRTLAVEDLKSLNGTFINGQQIDRGTAETGDTLKFGAVNCRLSATPIAASEESESLSTFRVSQSAPTVDISGLTPTQQEILSLLLDGLDEKQIAARTGRQPSTVHTHLKAIYEHFDVHSRTQLVVKVIKGRSQS